MLNERTKTKCLSDWKKPITVQIINAPVQLEHYLMISHRFSTLHSKAFFFRSKCIS